MSLCSVVIYHIIIIKKSFKKVFQ
uniref:Uncharacterized protein n=1 Tax=Anguilla anguilla TaxID=7936 RepID=A0A0E9P5Z4_ANGAN